MMTASIFIDMETGLAGGIPLMAKTRVRLNFENSKMMTGNTAIPIQTEMTGGNPDCWPEKQKGQIHPAGTKKKLPDQAQVPSQTKFKQRD